MLAPFRALRSAPCCVGAVISSTIAAPVQALINEFSKLPTIGPKTAARLVFHLLNGPRDDAEALAEAIVALKERVRLCSRCFAITEEDPCAICADPRRDRTIVCVVGEIPVTTWYRPLTGPLRAAGIPRPGKGKHAWYLDRADDAYRPLTAAARGELVR